MTNDNVVESRFVTVIVYVIVSPPFGSLLSTLFVMERSAYELVVAVDVDKITPSPKPESGEDAAAVDVGVVEVGVEVARSRSRVDDGTTRSVSDATVVVAVEEVDTEESASAVDVGVIEVGVEVARSRSRVDDGTTRSVSDATVVVAVGEEICVTLSSAEARKTGPPTSDRKIIPEATIAKRRAREDILFP